MVHLNPLHVAALALYTTSAMALPRPILGPVLELLGLQKGAEHKYATLSPTSTEGVFPTQHVAPTGTEVVALPTGAVFPSGLPGSFPVPTGTAKRDDKHHKHDKEKHAGHGKKKHHRKPQGLAQPVGTGSFPVPTGSVSDGSSSDDVEGTQERQFGRTRQRYFKPHWAGSRSENDSPDPTGTGAAAPTGTGALFPSKRSIMAHSDDDDGDEKHSEKKDKKNKKIDKASKKKASKKQRKPQGLAAPTGTGGFPMPTGSFSSGATPDGAAEGAQKRQFGAARKYGFEPHWAGAHESGFPAPTGTSPPCPTGTGH